MFSSFFAMLTWNGLQVKLIWINSLKLKIEQKYLFGNRKIIYFCSKRQGWAKQNLTKGIVFRFRYFLRGVFRCLLLGFGLSLTFQAVQNGHSKLTALPWTFTSDRQRLVTQRVYFLVTRPGFQKHFFLYFILLLFSQFKNKQYAQIFFDCVLNFN